MWSEYLRDPAYAALFAAVATIVYIHFKRHINNEQPPKPSDFMKPAALIAMLVYFIVSQGVATREAILTEPY
jgi:uncharacterized membrane protein YphA (DoxX/SURF4 family)